MGWLPAEYKASKHNREIKREEGVLAASETHAGDISQRRTSEQSQGFFFNRGALAHVPRGKTHHHMLSWKSCVCDITCSKHGRQ